MNLRFTALRLAEAEELQAEAWEEGTKPGDRGRRFSRPTQKSLGLTAEQALRMKLLEETPEEALRREFFGVLADEGAGKAEPSNGKPD